MDRLDAMAGFLAAADAGNLSAGARRLGVPLSTLSRKINDLERDLGTRLLTRTTRRMSLTSEGELYLEHARRILGAIDDLQELMGASGATVTGLLASAAAEGGAFEDARPGRHRGGWFNRLVNYLKDLA